jgi:hypothetical protein
VRQANDGLLHVVAGDKRRGGPIMAQHRHRDVPVGSPPATSTPALFYINGDRIYRAEGHPDGPSSIPYFRLTHRSIRPSEGFPSGPSERVHYFVCPIVYRRSGTTITITRDPDA